MVELELQVSVCRFGKTQVSSSTKSQEFGYKI